MLDALLPGTGTLRSHRFCIHRSGSSPLLIILASAILLMFCASIVALATWSSFFRFGEQQQQHDHTSMTISLANDELMQEGGLNGCVVIGGFLLGLFCIVVAAGLQINELGWAKVGGWLTAGFLLVVPCLPAISTTRHVSTEYAFVPSKFKIGQSIKETTMECHCVLFIGVVILTPKINDIAAIIINIVGNSVLALVRLLWRSKGHLSINAKSNIGILARTKPLDELGEYWMCGGEIRTSAGEILEEGEVFQASRKMINGKNKLELTNGRGLADDDEDKIGKKTYEELSNKGFVMTEYDIENVDSSIVGSWLDLKLGYADDDGEAGWVDVCVESVNPFMYKKEGSGSARRMMIIHREQETPSAHLRYYQVTKISFILWKSIRDPSPIFCVPTFGYHIYHFFAKLVPLGIKQGGISGFAVTYMSFINSGAMAYMMMAFFGAHLTWDRSRDSPFSPYSSSGSLIRFLSALALVLCIVPTFPFVFLGMITFAWFFLEMEFLLALLTRVAFPMGFYNVDEVVGTSLSKMLDVVNELRSHDNNWACKLFIVFWKALPLIFSVMFFSCFPLVRIFADRIGIVHMNSPLGNLSSCFVFFFLVMLKVIEWQFILSATMLFLFMDVNYLNAIPLTYLARDWRCNACLMQHSVEHTAELGILAWAQFYSMF